MGKALSDRERARVRRRRVFYIPGYDPIHPRRYRELYRKEGARQAAISGFDIALRPGQGGGAYGWHVAARIEDAPVEADFEVLVWSDIVRDSMSSSIPATYWQLLRTAWTYIASGALRRLMWLRKGPVIAALYPVGMLLLQLLLAGLAGWAVAALIGWLAGLVPLAGPVWAAAVLAARVFAAILAAVWLLRWFKAQDNRFYAHYLMHDYAYTAQARGANPPELEARMAAFADRIAEALREDVDEVLVVGHSSGAHLGVSVLADLIRAGGVRKGGPALGFLTLGQVVPMVSFLPEAHRLREDLMYLSTRRELTWVDVTAPGDGCAFALCDPVTVSGVGTDAKIWPLVISAAFTQTLSPERWKELRWRFFRLHFQYLCAFDRPGDYDYFRITAGPRTLAARFEGRAPSKSRIDVPASKYTSVRAA
ncbi:hypothetical protein [Jhaorihella thermophila]|uniref:Lipase (Class 3) n=1 Tax=Jhaorihella thermophila TaxID=488547 RepID=A0A1H5SL12_9RHOB|nr:hypothetical protein [Jhaorihella thermophila]SEF51134.1 hypothetical protein SAMN05421751_101593 [Jhaorihella thermophila]